MFPHLRYEINNLLEDNDEREVRRQFLLERRLMRDRADPFALTEDHFIQLFRLNKDMVRFLIDEIMPHMHNSSNYNAIHPVTQLFSALSFFATGTYQRVIGQSFQLSLSQQSVSRSINTITNLIVHQLADRFINFPQTPGRKIAIKRKFMEKCRFPGVIGAIDCTHIAIIAPAIEEHNYFNRKGYHSKNVPLICDYDLEILNINARYPGSCHDAFIWRNSIIQEELQHAHLEGDKMSWLLGDSGYPQQPWLMTPINSAIEDSPEFRYSRAHASARNCVERCNGVLKGRFRCLSGERKLRYIPSKAGDIAVACAVLHNLCIRANLENDFEIPINNEPQDYHVPPQNQANDDNGFTSRTLLVNRYFSN